MSDTPRTDAAKVDLRECISTEIIETGKRQYVEEYVPINIARQLERALSRFEQAELPEEPSGVQFVRNDVRGYGREAINYIDALRAHAARMTVERDEAKERAEAFDRIFSLQTGDVKRLVDADIRAESAERRAEALQAKIDALMFEHCPDEMTPEQITEWERHQVTVSESEMLRIAARSEEGKDNACPDCGAVGKCQAGCPSRLP